MKTAILLTCVGLILSLSGCKDPLTGSQIREKINECTDNNLTYKANYRSSINYNKYIVDIWCIPIEDKK